MALTLRYDAATPIAMVDPDGVVPTAASVSFIGADGANRSLTSSVTLPSASSTVASATATSATLASATGFVAGQPVQVTAGGRPQVATVTRIEGATLRFSVALDAAPDVGSNVRALQVSATVSAPGISLLGPNHRLVWSYNGADGVARQRVDAVSVVRYLPDPPVTATEVRGIAALLSPSSVASRDASYWSDIAARVAQRIEAELGATGRRSALYGDPNAFREAGRLLTRIYLADDGLMPAGVMPDSYTKDLSIRLQAELRTAVSGLAYDQNGDGAISPAEATPRFYSVRVRL